MSERDFQALEEMLAEMQTCVDNEDNVTYSELNAKYHHYIYDRCGNETLIDTINSLWEKTRISRNVFLMDRERMVPSLAEHRECLAYLRSGDADAVQKAWANHKENGFAAVEKGLKRLV